MHRRQVVASLRMMAGRQPAFFSFKVVFKFSPWLLSSPQPEFVSLVIFLLTPSIKALLPSFNIK